MTTPNFRIIENSLPRYLEVYDEFIKLYSNKKYSKQYIMMKLDLSDNQYKKALAKGVKEGLIVKRKSGHYKHSNKKGRKNPKNYYRINNGRYWRVSKEVNGKIIACSCKDENECQKLVSYLNKNGWSNKNIKLFKEEYGK